MCFIQESLHHLQQFYGRLQIPNAKKWPSKAFVQVQGQFLLFRRSEMAKKLNCKDFIRRLGKGCALVDSTGELGVGVKCAAESAERKDWAQWSLWVSKVKSRDKLRTDRVQVPQSTQKLCSFLADLWIALLFPHCHYLNLEQAASAGIFLWTSVEFGFWIPHRSWEKKP